MLVYLHARNIYTMETGKHYKAIFLFLESYRWVINVFFGFVVVPGVLGIQFCCHIDSGGHNLKKE